MGWVWSDELADTLRDSPETAPLVPRGWTARPCAFSTDPDEDREALGRRLLGLATPPEAQSDPAQSVTCTCAG
jgi:hypothetical protein